MVLPFAAVQVAPYLHLVLNAFPVDFGISKLPYAADDLAGDAMLFLKYVS